MLTTSKGKRGQAAFNVKQYKENGSIIMTNLITQHRSNRKLTLSSFPPASANHPTTSDEAYVYDAVGNRLTDMQARNYTYNNGNELLTQNGTSFTYDANGNTTSKIDTCGTTIYQYDYENRLIGISGFNAQCALLSASFKYDPFGRRIEKKTTVGRKTTTTKYLYDREDILYELDASNNIITKYIHGPGIDEPLAMIKSGNLYYYHADGLGSITTLTSSRARVSQQYRYDAFGNITYMKDTRFIQPYTYTGREYDSETGLYYYRARYYDAKVGRFISKDPIGFGGGINLYEYSRNNPLRYTDPFGLLLYDQMKSLVGGNNLSGQSNELIICVCWKESGFNPSAQSGTSTARGLMQVTKAAAKDAGYSYDQLFDGATNVKAGSKYLKLRIQWAGGNVMNGLNGYGTGSGYATDILQCEKCLKDNPCDSQKCLNKIHP